MHLKAVQISLFYLLVAALVAVTSVGLAQVSPEPIEFDREQLEKFRNYKDFNYQETENPGWFYDIISYIYNLINRFFRFFDEHEIQNPFWVFVLKMLPYLIIGLVVLLVIYVIYRSNPEWFNKAKPAAKVQFSNTELNEKPEDLLRFIAEAEAQENFRSAYRYSFALLLKQLHQEELISLDNEKTNSDYVSEFKLVEKKSDFKQLCYVYDYVWYGEFSLEKDQYYLLKHQITRLTQQKPVQHENV